jgi:hypothetical protein
LSPSLFDSDFLGEVVKSWYDNKHLIKLSQQKIIDAEKIATFLKII